MTMVPSGWTTAAIGQLIELNPRTDAPDSTMVGFVPMQALGTSFRSRLTFEPRTWHTVKKAYTHFGDGDVLLAKITPCFENGKAGLAYGLPNQLGAGSSEFFVCRPRAAVVEARYLLAWVSGEDFRSRAAVQMTGSVGHKRVPKEFLLGDVLPLAPYAEQQRIADKLDTVLARVDACCDGLARVAPLLKRFRQSVLESVTHADSPKQELRTLLQFVRTGPFGSSLHKSDYVEGGIPIVNPMHIVDGRIRPSIGMTVSRETAQRLTEFRMAAGDVVIGRRGEMGRCAVVTKAQAGWVCGTGSMVLRPKAKVLPEFLQLLLSSPSTVRTLEGKSVGSTMVNLNQEILLGLRVRCPEVDEQARIVKRVETLFAWADRLEARLTNVRTSVDRLTPSLFAKAFRGELVQQDPADEPARVLLKGLRSNAAEKLDADRPRRRAAAAST